jgi:molybdopterin biosynthesis enzyme
VEVGAFSAGSRPLVATQRGVLDIEVDRLRRVNSVEGACIYTLYDGLIAEAGETVARAKITPFVLAERCVHEAERIASDGGHGVVRVRPFVSMTVGAVVKESLGGKAMARFRDALERKITWFGSRLLEPSFVPPTADAIAEGIESLVANGAHVITIAGAKAMDPLDPAFVALERLGIGLDRFGAPAHPGSLFWIAHVRDVPILGMPTCGLFSKATVFDLVLPRVLTGERLTNATLAELGHGGMLTRDMAYRFPQYDPTKSRGALE